MLEGVKSVDKHDGNVAFKCTYNDGGQQSYVGFDGTCSNGNILRNVVTNPRTWCSDAKNECQMFRTNGFKGRRPIKPCYESELIQRWRYGAGFFHTGKRAGEPISMNHAKLGKVALFTTRHPELDNESDRLVFGISRIERIIEDKNGATWIHGDRSMCIRLAESTAFALPYWKYKSLPKRNKPEWGSGLFRYISDAEVLDFLHDLYPLLRNAEDRNVAEQLAHGCGGRELSPSLPSKNVKPSIGDTEQKYGPGGEGKRHRELKAAIARRPELLGLGPGKTTMEHRFITGDRLDVLVELDKGKKCVIEVEVEGQSTLIGAHQALKYRALISGEMDDRSVPYAFLVAYGIPKNVQEFCKRHNIRTLEVNL